MNKIILWIIRIIPAVIFLQTLYFKFTASPESVYIFSTLGLEPYGRITIGILEIIASILLLINSTYFYGALLGFGLIVGAIFSHLTRLGIVVQNDGGFLFGLAIVNFILTGIILINHRKKFMKLLKFDS